MVLEDEGPDRGCLGNGRIHPRNGCKWPGNGHEMRQIWDTMPQNKNKTPQDGRNGWKMP